MKHFKQGINECFPSALGCYLERDPREIIKEILEPEFPECSWYDVSSSIIKTSMEYRYRFYAKIDLFLAQNLPWLPFKAYVIRPNTPISLMKWPLKPPYGLRGFMTLVNFIEIFDGISMVGARHIIAFENDKIYDSNLDGPIAYDEYLNLLAKLPWFDPTPRIIDGIYVEGKQ